LRVYVGRHSQQIQKSSVSTLPCPAICIVGQKYSVLHCPVTQAGWQDQSGLKGRIKHLLYLFIPLIHQVCATGGGEWQKKNKED